MECFEREGNGCGKDSAVCIFAGEAGLSHLKAMKTMLPKNVKI